MSYTDEITYTFTADAHNVRVVKHGVSDRVLFNPNGADRTISGIRISNPRVARLLFVINVGANTIEFLQNDAGSDPENRFNFGVVMAAGAVFALLYEPSLERWSILSGTVTSPGGGEANTSSNVGGGAEAALPKVGVDLPFRTFVGANGIQVNELTETISIDGSTIGAYTVTAGDGLTGGGAIGGNPTINIVAADSTITVNADSIAVNVGAIDHGGLAGLGDDADHPWAMLAMGTVVDNRLMRTDGTGGRNVQQSAASIDDSGNASGFASVAINTNPATAGHLRVASGFTLQGRDAGNANNRQLFAWASDALTLGHTSHASTLNGSTVTIKGLQWPSADGTANQVMITNGSAVLSFATVTSLGVPPNTRTITAGAGLTGGGDLSDDRTIDIVAADSSITVNADSIAVNQGAIDHGSLAGLGDAADHAWAFLHDGSRAATGDFDMGIHSIANAISVEVQAVGSPEISWYQTGASADNRRWKALAISGRWELQAISDDFLTTDTVITVNRSGAAATEIDFSAALDMNANNINDVDVLTSKAYVARHTTPYLKFDETDAGADAKKWRFRVGGQAFSLQLMDDAESSTFGIFDVGRLGMTPSAMTFGVSLDLNGNDISGVDDLTLESSGPILQFVDTDGSTDGKRWRIGTDNDDLIFAWRDDANTSNFGAAAVFRRTGATLDYVEFPSSFVRANRTDDIGVVTPSPWAITQISVPVDPDVTHIRASVSSSEPYVLVGGFSGGTQGRKLYLSNIGTAGTILLQHGVSISCPRGIDFPVAPGDTVMLVYDGTSNLYRVVASRLQNKFCYQGVADFASDDPETLFEFPTENGFAYYLEVWVNSRDDDSSVEPRRGNYHGKVVFRNPDDGTGLSVPTGGEITLLHVQSGFADVSYTTSGNDLVVQVQPIDNNNWRFNWMVEITILEQDPHDS